MLPYPMLALSKSEGFTLSLEGLSSQTSFSPDPHPHFSTLPLPSVNSVPSALEPPINNATPHTSPHYPSAAAIPLRITFLADPYLITPIESHSCKKQGRGYLAFAAPNFFLFFP